MKKAFQFAAAVFFLQCLLFSEFALGQLPNARLQRVYPCSAKTDSQVEVTLSGADLDEATELVFSNSKITGKAKMNPATEFSPATPVAGQFIVNVPADVAPGIYEVRAMGRFGLSTARRFVVSDHAETVCSDQNKTPESAIALALNSSSCGRAVANGRHFYKFSLQQNEKVTIECQTKALDSKMDPVLVISDLSGNEIARGRSTTIQSATILFKAPIASQYILSVRDAVFSGGADHFYRLTLSKNPYLLATHPCAIQKNTNPDLQLMGWNLPGGKESDGIELLQVKSNEVLGAINDSEAMLLAPNSYEVQCQSVGLRQAGKPISNRIPVLLSDLPVISENQSAPFTNVTVPASVSGRFAPKNEIDDLRFAAKKGEIYFIDVLSHRIGKSTDPILMVQQQVKDGQGNETWKNVAVQDDLAGRGAIGPDFSLATDDPGYRFQAPQDGSYRLLIKDQFGTYDIEPDAGYVVSIRKPEPDFRLIGHPVYGRPANANQILASSLALRRGGRFQVRIQVDRRDGFTGPIALSCEGLPAGVTFEPAVIPLRQSDCYLTFHADEKAATGKSLVKIQGKARIGEKEIVRDAICSAVVWDTANKGQTAPYFRRSSSLEVSVIPHESAAVTVNAGDKQVLETSLGGKIKLPIKLKRRNNFVEALKLTAVNLPGQLKPADITIAKSKDDGAIEIFVKDKNTPLGEYFFSLKGDAKFKYSRNPEAATKQEAEQKRLEELLKTTNAEKTTATNQLNQLKNSLPAMDQAIAAAKTALTTENKRLADLAKQAEALSKQIQAAKTAKQPKVGELDLPTAEKKLADLKSQSVDATKKQSAETALKQAEQKKTDAMAMIADVQKKLAAATDKAKKVDAAAKAAKAKTDQLKKQIAPKDLFYVAVSNPIQIRVVASPIVVEPITESNLVPESVAKTSVKIQRKYGFAEAVNLTFKAPKGIQVKPASIPKDKSAIDLEVTIAKDCPTGKHSVEMTTAAKFNNVDVRTVATFVVQVNKKPAATPPAKPAPKKSTETPSDKSSSVKKKPENKK